MTTVRDITSFMEQLAPNALAEEWDNVGLLLGDGDRRVERVMTCLTITPETVQEACEQSADLVISHHPLPFRAIRRITTDSLPGRLLWRLASHQVAVYSAHTAFDSSHAGINQQIATALGLQEIQVLRPADGVAESVGGGGRHGRLDPPLSVGAFIERVKSVFGIAHLWYVDGPDDPVTRVAVACGAADEFLADAIGCGCNGFVTGESRFHTLLEAQANGVCVALPGHFASERFAMERLATELDITFPDIRAWAATERDPLTLG